MAFGIRRSKRLDVRIDLRKPHALLTSGSFHSSKSLLHSGRVDAINGCAQGFSEGMPVAQDGSQKETG